MPVSSVAARAGGDGSNNLLQVTAASRVPETDRLAGEVDLVGDVVPDAGLPLHLPLGGASDEPLEARVLGAAGAGDEAALQLGEVRLEEGDLVLAGQRRRVLSLALDAEVVKDLAGGDGGARLGDQLGAAHGLAVPVGSVRQGDLGTLRRAAISGIGVGGREIHILGDLAVAVDVVLVRPDLVGPAPFVEVGGRREIVEAAIPKDLSGSQADEGSDSSE